MPTIEAVRLTKRYGARTAVDELSFTARPGEIVGLLGPNGAGKTTTIRLLTTILRPTAGTIWVAGADGNEPARIRQRIGVLPESAGYPARQTGREYLRYSGRLFGLNRDDATETADRLLTEVGLRDRAGSRISTYSRGMRQRLGIARALVNDPAVVFLDEPTLGLDPAGQREVLRTVRQIAQHRGATVLLSTHTLPEVEEVCTTVLILDQGRVVTSGTVAEVIRTVGVRRTGRLQVAAESVPEATRALARLPRLTFELVEDRPDVLVLDLGSANGTRTSWNDVLRAVVAADVPVLSFEADATRLSDAFLTLTEESAP